MDQTLYNVTSIVSTVLIIGTIIGGFLAVRNGFMKATSEMQKNAGDYQAQAISALREEVTTLRAKQNDLHNENIRLQQVIQTICEALKLRDIVISIDGTMVNIRDNGNSTTSRIHESQVNGVLELFDSDKQQFGFISQLNSAPGVETSQVMKPISQQFRNPRIEPAGTDLSCPPPTLSVKGIV